MRPEAKVQRRGDRSAPDFSWLFASSAMYVASLREMTREKRNHIRHHQPQKPTVRESGVAPMRGGLAYRGGMAFSGPVERLTQRHASIRSPARCRAHRECKPHLSTCNPKLTQQPRSHPTPISLKNCDALFPYPKYSRARVNVSVSRTRVIATKQLLRSSSTSLLFGPCCNAR